jgi:hypothetical protein
MVPCLALIGLNHVILPHDDGRTVDRTAYSTITVVTAVAWAKIFVSSSETDGLCADNTALSCIYAKHGKFSNTLPGMGRHPFSPCQPLHHYHHIYQRLTAVEREIAHI